MKHSCPECGASLDDDTVCRDYFEQMLAWESEDLVSLFEVHHLMVLAYYLQHPSLYSPHGLAEAQWLLIAFVEDGQSPAKVRRHSRAQVDSGKRTWKITGTPESHGSYAYPIRWPMTAADVIEGGRQNYCANVHAWAHSIDDTLKASGNFARSVNKKH